MIARLLFLAALLAGSVGRLLALDVGFTSIPPSAGSGQSYYVEAYSHTWNGDGCDVTLYKNSGWFESGMSPYDTAYIGVWTTDYGVQTVEYFADGHDWYSGQYAYAYAWVTITQPNNPPTISWSSAPASCPVTQSAYVEAHGNDADGNLTQVNVWRDGTPHAFGGGANGYDSYSGNPWAQGTAGAVTFVAQAVDGNGAASGVIYHTVYFTENNAITFNYTDWSGTAFMSQGVNFYYNITNSGTKSWGPNHYLTLRDWNWNNVHFPSLNGMGPGWNGNVGLSFTAPATPGTYTYNVQALEHMVEWFGPQQALTLQVVNRAPVSPTLSSGGVTQINLGQSVTISGTLQDPDGNLAYHNLYYAAPGGGWTEMLSGTPSGGGYSSLSTTFTPTALGSWQFLSNGHDGYAWSPGATLSVAVIDGTAPGVPNSLSASANTTGTSFTLNWAAVSDNVGVTGYEVMRNATSLGTTGALLMNITGLAQATNYAMKVRARDAAGNWSAWSTVLNIATPDVTAPTVPGSLSASANTTGTSFTLNWAASSDNIGVTAYEVMRDSTSLGTTGSLSMSVTGLTQVTTYGMKVRARDAAGNWSAWSSPVYNVTTPDVSAPTVPTGLIVSANTTGTSFTLSWTASTDNVGVAAYEVMRDSTSLGTTASVSMPVTGLAQVTTYGMKVRARDAANNWSPWSGALNATTPDVTGPTVPGNLSATNIATTSFTFSWSAASDNVGVTLYEVFRNGASQGTTASLSLNVTGLTPGTSYSMIVKARDAAGNWSAAQGSPLPVTTSDPDAPTVPGGLAASANTTGTSFTLSWAASTDNSGVVAAYQVRRGSTTLAPDPTGTSMSVTGLTPGLAYDMTVRARDAAGNWSGWSNSLPVTTPDSSPPSTPTGLVVSALTHTSFTLSWTASTDNGVVTAYEVRRDSTTLTPNPIGTSMSITGLSPATVYAMTVRARDTTGNWSAWSSGLNVTTTLDPAGDADGDGMTNGWETQYGLNPNNAADATGDLDNDGVNNLLEFRLGTNPAVAKSADSTNQTQLKIHRPNP